jgi:nicotinamidase-related amidase
VDLQSALVPHLEDGDRVVRRAKFLVDVSRALEIPLIATEQNPVRMGSLVSELGIEHAFAKMSFGVGGCPEAMRRLRETGRREIVIVGCETHICVSLTAHELLGEGYEVIVCPDAVGARTLDRHKLGMERIRDAGVVPAHTEAIAYEWMTSAEHPAFKTVLGLVKAAG